MRPFNRIKVNDEAQLKRLIIYIHLNPVKAGFCKKPQDWSRSSYNQVLASDNTVIRAEEVLSLFDDVINFRVVHGKNSDWLPEFIKND